MPSKYSQCFYSNKAQTALPCRVYLEYFSDLCPLPLRGMNIQEIPEMKQLWERCLIMMKALSFSLMVCNVILSAHSVKNCSLGKSQPLKAFGDFKPGRRIFLSFVSLWQELKYSTSFQGWRGGGMSGTKAIGSGSLGSLPWGEHHFWIYSNAVPVPLCKISPYW